MATLLSAPSMQVTFSFLRKVICEPMQPHGDAAQLAANVGRKVTSEQWQRNLFKRTESKKRIKKKESKKMIKKNLYIYLLIYLYILHLHGTLHFPALNSKSPFC